MKAVYVGGVIILFWLTIIQQGCLLAQEPVKERQQSRADTTVEKEILLEDIHIEAVIEKPGVTLIPKRIEPEVSTVPLAPRSFEAEIQDRPEKLDQEMDKYEAPEKAKDIKKYLAKQKKSK